MNNRLCFADMVEIEIGVGFPMECCLS